MVTPEPFQAKTELEAHTRKRIRLLLAVIVIGLILSGLTAFPIQSQLEIAHHYILTNNIQNAASEWLERVYNGVSEMGEKYPFISYGTDWLAFAHLVIAVAFIGPLRDPVRNIWVIQFGLIACAAVFPLALIEGPIRGIPVFWRLIDCSFGLIGGLVLWVCYKQIRKLEQIIINKK